MCGSNYDDVFFSSYSWLVAIQHSERAGGGIKNKAL